jgi:hypothetical protein
MERCGPFTLSVLSPAPPGFEPGPLVHQSELLPTQSSTTDFEKEENVNDATTRTDKHSGTNFNLTE